MPEITPEQREAALRAMEIEEDKYVIFGNAGLRQTHLEALIALGWRAPGPPTEGEVERAAAVLAIEDGRDWEKPVIREIYGERYAGLARAAMIAALGRPE